MRRGLHPPHLPDSIPRICRNSPPERPVSADNGKSLIGLPNATDGLNETVGRSAASPIRGSSAAGRDAGLPSRIEVIVNALVAYKRLHAKGQAELAYPTVPAMYGPVTFSYNADGKRFRKQTSGDSVQNE